MNKILKKVIRKPTPIPPKVIRERIRETTTKVFELEKKGVMKTMKVAQVRSSTKRNPITEESKMNRHEKKSRRKLIVQKDDEEDEAEKTELEDLSQVKVATHKNP